MRALAVLVAAACLGCGRDSDSAPTPEQVTYADSMMLPFGRVHPGMAAVDSLSVRWTSHYLRAMNEPRLDPRMFPHDVYRFVYMPSLGRAIALRLMRRPGGCLYVRKEVRRLPLPEASLQAGTRLEAFNERLEISAVDSVPVGRLECGVIVTDMARLRLGADRDTSFVVGPDGEMWLFEEIRDGRYQAGEAWSPDSTRGASFYRAGMTFIRVARYGGDGFPARPTTFPY